MMQMIQYLQEYIDDTAEIRTCGPEILDNLPLVLRGSFDYYELRIMNVNTLLIRPVEKQTVRRFQNWMHQIEGFSGMYAILWLDQATPYMIKKMLAERIAFIMPGRQINIPFLVMTVRTEKEKLHKTILKFSPCSQLIFLFVLYSENNEFSIEELASVLNISKMSAQRGLSELENLGLMFHVIGGKTGRKKVFERINKKEFYGEGKKYLDNPVRSIVYVKQMPDLTECVISDLSALAEQTMLGEPEQKRYALYSRYKNRLDDYVVTEEEALEKKLPIVQLMKYDVSKISRNDFIDPISMILSLSENDERIQISVDEMMKEYNWYINEDEEW